jgi:hypothetical protein
LGHYSPYPQERAVVEPGEAADLHFPAAGFCVSLLYIVVFSLAASPRLPEMPDVFKIAATKPISEDRPGACCNGGFFCMVMQKIPIKGLLWEFTGYKNSLS